ncbi:MULTISPECIES: futalosine hydrolase [Streptomyces]|uniref:futalosine hydrolase n=1 Tax=Streptomyces TaxID=1883 RepID=UPI00163C1899|nr:MULTISPECIES: futalosine hydrolase [Streptomyces]MBC2874874.1 futalosine hydrolase [Streptomyces sp. TYQ1024]UBI37320.1 futalosine hydrolase [Streptomyces mobaraensis]UKW29911.1 futalosine hydrolase [Streptomyces sp. TYQ1024]
MRVLVVTAVAAERSSVTAAAGPAGPGEPEEIALPGGAVLHRIPAAGVTYDVLAAGVGPAAAAAGTATALTAAALAGAPYDLAVSAGIGGGFAPGAPLGGLIVARRVVAADLGAATSDGFLPVTELGFGVDAHPVDDALVDAVGAATGARPGDVLTVSTVTGTAARAAELAARYPDALAEAMEGFGVAEAAAAHGVPVLELRAVSNAVGPRDRAAWRIGDALAALTEAFRAMGPALAGRTPAASEAVRPDEASAVSPVATSSVASAVTPEDITEEGRRD